MKMTLNEAIAHAKELSESQLVCENCREEHKQLAEWLEELRRNKDKQCEISAREMFKKLGYRCIKSDRSIWYINDSDVENYGSIEFWFCDCTFEATGNYGDPLMVNVKELEAINKQCEELGWI